MLRCYVCSDDFVNVTQLYSHMKSHQITGSLALPYRCGQKLRKGDQTCVKSFQTLKVWAQHLRTFHRFLEDEESVVLEPKRKVLHVENVSCSQDAMEVEETPDEVPHISHENSPTNSGEPENYDFMKKIAAAAIAKFRADSATTGTAAVKAVNCCNEIVETIVTWLQTEVSNYISGFAPNLDCGSIMDKFEAMKRPLDFLDSDWKQKKYFKDHMGFVEPIPVPYGPSHTEIRYVEGRTQNHQVYDTWQYVPLLDTLRSLFSNTDLSAKLGQNDAEQNRTTIEDFRHGRLVAENKYFSEKTRKVIAIELYYDDVEPANPLGSKATIHKIAVFYFTIKNLPFHLTCSMANIHLLALAYTDDVTKKYGFDCVLNRFVKDLRILETEGILVSNGNEEERIYGSLALVSGDNLATHYMLGFVGGFRANYFCETCLVYQHDIQTNFDEKQFELRSYENYNNQLEAMARGDATETDTGLKRNCVLNQLENWHVTENKTGDLFHDFLEGIGPFEVKLVLAGLVKSGVLTLNDLNDRITKFPYGPTDVKQRPINVPNLNCDDHSLKQKAMQFWTLFRLLPLIIGDIVPFENSFWQFYLELRIIADLLFAQKWTKGNFNYYRTLYGEHLSHFKHLFPNYKLIPKHHILIHYATFAEFSGPPYKTMVATKEMKGNFLKRNAHIMCNFKNVPYSLAMKHQIFAMSSLLSGKVFSETVEMERVSTYSIHSLPVHDELCQLLKVSSDTEVQVATKFIVWGQSYKCGMAVVVSKTSIDNHLLNFGRIFGGILVENKLYLLLRMYQPLYFDKHLHSFCCTLTANNLLIRFSEILDFHPLDAYAVAGSSDEFHIATRYDVF